MHVVMCFVEIADIAEVVSDRIYNPAGSSLHRDSNPILLFTGRRVVVLPIGPTATGKADHANLNLFPESRSHCKLHYRADLIPEKIVEAKTRT